MDTAERDKTLLKEALLDTARVDLGGGVDEPDAVELQAYLAGELTEERDEQVRAWLVATEGASERLLELASFVEAQPPADDEPADHEEEKARRELQRRLASSELRSALAAAPAGNEPLQTLAESRPEPSYRWWQAAAAVLAITTGLLLLRVFDLESQRDLQNLRKLSLVADTRGGAVTRFSIVAGEPFLVEISPEGAGPGCESYRVELLELDGTVLRSVENLKLTDYMLRFVLSAQPGQRLLTVSACSQLLDRFRVDLVVDRL